MDCESALNLVSARLDGQIAPADADALEKHLTDCTDCQAAEEELRTQHERLRRAFAPRREAAAALAARVTAEMLSPSAPVLRGEGRGEGLVLATGDSDFTTQFRMAARTARPLSG